MCLRSAPLAMLVSNTFGKIHSWKKVYRIYVNATPSWIEPHPFEKLIEPQSKTGFETIQPQLKYNPTLSNQKQ
jgi:hypothetical protein